MNVTCSASAMYGIRNGMQQLEAAAQQVSGGSGNTQNLVEGLVGAKVAQRQIEAAARVLSVEGDALGALIDVSA